MMCYYNTHIIVGGDELRKALIKELIKNNVSKFYEATWRDYYVIAVPVMDKRINIMAFLNEVTAPMENVNGICPKEWTWKFISECDGECGFMVFDNDYECNLDAWGFSISAPMDFNYSSLEEVHII